MELEWNKDVIDLQKLIHVSRGDRTKIQRYLIQFQDLIPTRTEILNQYIRTKDRTMVRQTVHQMSPQLHFFGVPEIHSVIQKIEEEYQSLPIDELEDLVKNIQSRLNFAKEEVDRIMDTFF